MKRYCCDEFIRARQSGTDNEAFGKLIHLIASEYFMGSDLAPISYCPWCGYEIEDEEE